MAEDVVVVVQGVGQVVAPLVAHHVVQVAVVVAVLVAPVVVAVAVAVTAQHVVVSVHPDAKAALVHVQVRVHLVVVLHALVHVVELMHPVPVRVADVMKDALVGHQAHHAVLLIAVRFVKVQIVVYQQAVMAHAPVHVVGHAKETVVVAVLHARAHAMDVLVDVVHIPLQGQVAIAVLELVCITQMPVVPIVVLIQMEDGLRAPRHTVIMHALAHVRIVATEVVVTRVV